MGTGETGLADAFPLDNSDTTLTLPSPYPGQLQEPTEIPGFSQDVNSEIPDMSVLESRVIQSGGNTIRWGTARKLNKYYGVNYNRREWGRALEELKRASDLPNRHHGKIEEDGSYTDRDGNYIDNIFDYLP